MISGPTCDAENCVLLSGVKHRLRRLMVENHFLNRCIVSELQLFLGVSALRGAGHLPRAEMEEVVEIK